MEYTDYAKEILSQMIAIDRMGLWAWGATQFTSLREGPIFDGKYRRAGLMFHVQGMKFKGAVIINLMANDTYTVQLMKRLKGGDLIETKRIDDLYCDNFMQVIDSEIER